MSFACACDVDDSEGWYYYKDDCEFKPLNTKRRQRCVSCRDLIDVGADCGEFERYRPPQNDIEERIWGDEVKLASWYMCEDCYGCVLSVEEAGGCLYLSKGENVRDAVRAWRAEFPEGCNG